MDLSTKPPTVKDVAARAGVSRSTASRALSGEGYVADDVRARVAASARELGYVLDVNARSLRKGDSRTIGLVVSELRDPFYAELAAGISSAARAAGFRLALVDCGGSEIEAERAIDTLLGMRVVGALITPFNSALTEAMVINRVPVVEVDRVSEAEGASAVVVENTEGARAATEHLIALGHRQIAFVIDETDWSTGAGRLRGYRAALKRNRIETGDRLVIRCGFSADAAAKAVGDFLESSSGDVTAIFAANNVVAEGAWRELRSKGVRVPTDISFLAFDDSAWMTMVEPGVDCVRQPVSEMGSAAVQTLMGMVNGVAPKTVTLGTELVLRGSVARCAAPL